MSILDFAKNLGRQVFDRDDVAADKIKQELEIRLSGIKDLDVQFDDGVVTLCGDCLVKGDRQQAILIAGNIQGVEKVVAEKLNAPAPPPEAPPEPEEKEEFYEIQKGDTLGAIAKRYYGNASKYTRIFEANRNVIEDANKIYPGQKIRIPMD
jgi:nucleoid-associated protein YgaU